MKEFIIEILDNIYVDKIELTESMNKDVIDSLIKCLREDYDIFYQPGMAKERIQKLEDVERRFKVFADEYEYTYKRSEELSQLRDMLTKKFNMSRTAPIEDLVEEISKRILKGYDEAEEKEETINYLRHELTKIFDLTDHNHYYAEDIINGIKKKVVSMNFKENKK